MARNLNPAFLFTHKGIMVIIAKNFIYGATDNKPIFKPINKMRAECATTTIKDKKQFPARTHYARK